MRNKLVERFTISFYEENLKDEILLKVINFHSNSERFRGNKMKEWAYEYLKEHPELFEEMESMINKEMTTTKENASEAKNDKKEQVSNLKSKLNIITSKKVD